MAYQTPIFIDTRICAATLLCIASIGRALAQSNPPEITITSPSPQQVSGFGDTPLSKAPFSAISIDNQSLRDVGAKRISDALRLDASVTDSYNSPAYWDMLSVRGYTLDNRYNYRREGLPISAETMIPMENKERIELLKGTSGIQAGTSSPGGLANYVVKRAPTGNDETIRAVTTSYGNGKSSSIGLDLGSRFGETKEFGYRFNTAYEDLNPYIKNTKGHRNLIALAMDWRMSGDSRLEFEFENSERQQIGVNGYSLLAPASDLYGQPSLPGTVNSNTNITAQSWTLPGVFYNTSGSIRFKKNLSNGWMWTTQYGGQRLQTDDRLAYAYGVDCRYPNYTLCDRFVAGPSFDIYDYRSENERRLTDSLQSTAHGHTEIAGKPHHLSFSIMRGRQLDRLQATQLYSFAGNSNSYGGVVPAQTDGTTAYNTNRSEYSSELSLRDRIEVSSQTSIWVGLRYTSSSRTTVSLDPTNPNLVNQSKGVTTPWFGMSNEYASGSTVYASYGEGVEMIAAPNNVNYTNAGQFLGVHRSKQLEVGAKGKSNPNLSWNAAVFQIDRPLSYDYAFARVVNGIQAHAGLDAGLQWTYKQWLLSGQAQWVHARISGVPHEVGLGNQPLNVPAITVRALAQHRWIQIPGLRTSLRLSHEGQRRVKEDGSINLPAWTTLDFAAHYETQIQGTRNEWTLGIENLTNQQYWRESPKQFGHYYLYAGAPRNLRLTVRTQF